MTETRQRAIDRQAEASDPAVSAFVEASAGSGKTKLLTDRILRLMLGGAHPGRIQCLTFTKAAAAEMALRLQHRLGAWVTLDDAELDKALLALKMAPDTALRARARELFATVLDLPGGIRIGTIHAFCTALLQRFPLEAMIPPHFEVVEETEAEAQMQQAREAALVQADPAALTAVAGLLRAEAFGTLVTTLQGERARLEPLLARPPAERAALVWRAAGDPPRDEQAVLAAAVAVPDESAMEAAMRIAAAHGAPTTKERGGRLLAWLSLPPQERVTHWDHWLGEFVSARDGALLKFGSFPNAALDKLHPEIREFMLAEQERVWRVEDTRRAIRCAHATLALLDLAAPSLAAYQAQKDRAGLLDYSDLIGRAERLLEDPGAAWVLYKLDGGIDHLLLDEVQDTAPAQWRIAHRLTEEFFAGQGARDDGKPRTFFAVGDPKQSIYSFQGADPAEFTRSRAEMADRVRDGGQVWRDVGLDVSFRSTEPVLGLVDAVFEDAVARQGVADAGGLKHFADRAGHAGQVTLWPLAPAPEKPERAPWSVPAENLGMSSAPQRLAEAIALHLRRLFETGARLESQNRPLEPGDVMILVRRRGVSQRGRPGFASTLIRALKAQGVPVAGLDRLALTEQIAVQDLLAACEAVLLPEDDLAVACVLTSPLGGLPDDSLMALALGRQHSLWDTLRTRAPERSDWTAAWQVLARLAERADFVSPHAFLVEVLGRLGGRARLLARLGAEAAEPIDELLNAALDYARLHTPSLQGFVHWVRRSGAEVKREAGGAGPVVRVMTVHGAKGLQAPLVIVPDTTALPNTKAMLDWTEQDGVPVPLWAPNKALVCQAVTRARSVAQELSLREYNRLLYVALTRAEDRLILCGWQSGKTQPDTCWYETVRRGFDRLDAETAESDLAWGGQSRHLSRAQAAPMTSRPGALATSAAPLPAWAGRPGRWSPAPPPEESGLPTPLAPSRPEGAGFGPVPAALSPLLAGVAPRFERGNTVHALLQHLPALPGAAQQDAATRFMQRTTIPEAERDNLVSQVLAVLRHPLLAPLFGPAGRAEQPVSGLIGSTVISGVVDRLAVLPDRILVADFKTGRTAPADAADTPVRYVRQLAAYRAVLQGLFPGRPVSCALVWTEGACVTPLPDALLDAHAPGPGS